MAVATVASAAFAAGRLGVRHGRPFGERGGLAFAGALSLFELARQQYELGFEFGQALQ